MHAGQWQRSTGGHARLRREAAAAALRRWAMWLERLQEDLRLGRPYDSEAWRHQACPAPALPPLPRPTPPVPTTFSCLRDFFNLSTGRIRNEWLHSCCACLAAPS